MTTIYKYPLEITDVQIVQMPRDPIFLDVQVQNGVPCLWAMVAPARKQLAVRIRMVGTGHPCDDSVIDGKYIGTFQVMGGQLVFHVFEEAPDGQV